MAGDEILLQFRADMEELKRDLKNVSQEGQKGFEKINELLKGTEKAQKKVGQEASSLGNAFKGLQNRIIGAFSVNAIISFTGKLFEMQDALEQIDRKATVVFRETLPKMQAEADKTAHSIGLTKSQFLDATSSISLFLKNTGFATDEANKMAVSLLKVSSNLSLVNSDGKDAKTIAMDLARTLQGNTRSLKEYGFNINLSQTEMNELMEATEGTNNASKKKATTLKVLNEIMAQSVNITGDLNDELFKSEQLEREGEANLQERMEELARSSEGLKAIWLDIKIAAADFFSALLTWDEEARGKTAERTYEFVVKKIPFTDALYNRDIGKLLKEQAETQKEITDQKEKEQAKNEANLRLSSAEAEYNKLKEQREKEVIEAKEKGRKETEKEFSAFEYLLKLKQDQLDFEKKYKLEKGESDPLFDLTKSNATSTGLTQPSELPDEMAFDQRTGMVENEITAVGVLTDVWQNFFDTSVSGWLNIMGVMGSSERQIIIMEKIAGASKMLIEYLITLFKLKALKSAYISSGNAMAGALVQTQILSLKKDFITGIAGLTAVAIPEIAFASSAPRKFAKGVEKLDGLGTETSDSIPAYLSKGERVVTAKKNREYWDELSAIHNGHFNELMNAKYVMPAVNSALGELSTAEGLYKGMLMQRWKGENIVSEIYKTRVQDKQIAREMIEVLKPKRKNKRSW